MSEIAGLQKGVHLGTIYKFLQNRVFYFFLE